MCRLECLPTATMWEFAEPRNSGKHFFAHRNFQLAISVKHCEHPFEQLGSALANRQNNTIVAQVMRLAAKAICD